MNFQQLRVLQEAIKSDLNLTDAANSLFASQSGLSKQIKELEIELGIDIFVRKGKRITSLTPAGEGIAEIAGRILQEASNLKKYSENFVNADCGKLSIATTHNQARHILPSILKQFSKEYPDVNLDIRQGTPKDAATLLAGGEVDIAIATEALENDINLITFPCFKWHHIVIVPKGHELEKVRLPTIHDLAKYPIVTYSQEFSGRSKIDKAFREADIQADIRFTTMDSDIIKTYVQVGLGIGIISEMARPEIDETKFTIIEDSKFLFEQSTTKLAVRRGALVRKFALDFAAHIVPGLKNSNLKFGPKIAQELEKIHANLPDLVTTPVYKDWRKIYLGEY